MENTILRQMKPSEHAAAGWSHGQYKDGICLALMSGDRPDDVAEFRKEAIDRGAEYVALWNLPEYIL